MYSFKEISLAWFHCLYGLSNFVGYSVPKLSFWKNSNDTIYFIGGEGYETLYFSQGY